MKHLDPAKTIIAKVGGVDVVSAVTGKHISRVYRWMYPRERGGTDGLIPTAEARKILDYANREGVPLDAAEFFVVPASQPTEGAA